MRDWAARLVPDCAGPATSGRPRWHHPGCALLQSGLPWASRAHSPCGLDLGAGEPSVSVLFVLLITLAVGYLVYRIIADGLKSELLTATRLSDLFKTEVHLTQKDGFHHAW